MNAVQFVCLFNKCLFTQQECHTLHVYPIYCVYVFSYCSLSFDMSKDAVAKRRWQFLHLTDLDADWSKFPQYILFLFEFIVQNVLDLWL